MNPTQHKYQQIKLRRTNITVYTDKLSQMQLDQLANDPNCKRTFLGKDFMGELVRKGTTWHSIVNDGTWAGAVMIDPQEEDMACHHICALEGALSRDEAIAAVQLSVKISIFRGIKPYTTVPLDPAYNYMRKFLEDCDLVRLNFDNKFADVYTVKASAYMLMTQRNLEEEMIHEQG